MESSEGRQMSIGESNEFSDKSGNLFVYPGFHHPKWSPQQWYHQKMMKAVQLKHLQ